MSATRRKLSGWGRAGWSGGDVVIPATAAAVPEHLVESYRGVTPRGLGRSYGDAATNAGGLVLQTSALAGIRSFDPVTGIVRAGSGVSLDELMRLAVPHGWFPAVSPGTRQVTLGGAVAADIHGKNHHVEGSFASGVRGIELVAPAGQFSLAPGDPGFRATLGGMGLTGVVSEVELQLHPIPTSRVVVDTDRAANLDEVLNLMRDGDDRYRYSVAWIDLLARGKALGRSVLTRGNWAEPDDIGPHRRNEVHSFAPGEPIVAPPWMPNGLLNRWTVGAFNELWFRRFPRHAEGEVQSIGQFFHPLDGVGGWNRLYGSHGFLQYQFVVPFSATGVLREIIEQISGARLGCFLAVLKQFGDSNDCPLSFPMSGWTLALDIPSRAAGLANLLTEFDRKVVDCGGRVYLAKDHCLDAAMLPHMYLRLDEWRELRSQFDPQHVMSSDLDRRLSLTGIESSS